MFHLGNVSFVSSSHFLITLPLLSFGQLSAATDRIKALQEEEQELKQENELIRERSEKYAEVRY